MRWCVAEAPKSHALGSALLMGTSLLCMAALGVSVFGNCNEKRSRRYVIALLCFPYWYCMSLLVSLGKSFLQDIDCSRHGNPNRFVYQLELLRRKWGGFSFFAVPFL